MSCRSTFTLCCLLGLLLCFGGSKVAAQELKPSIEEDDGTEELYGKCMSLAEDYLNQYMLNGTIDMQKVVYDYANRTPCTFKKSSKRCCIAVDAIFGPGKDMHACTCFQEFLDIVTYKDVLPHQLVESQVQYLSSCSIPTPETCATPEASSDGEGDHVAALLPDDLQSAIIKSSKRLTQLANQLNRNLAVSGIPVVDYLRSSLDSAQVRGMSLQSFFSLKHLLQIYRSVTIFEFPLHRVVDLLVYQVTGIPDISLQESFDYIHQFFIGALQARLPSSESKDQIIHVMESIEVTMTEDVFTLDSFDVRLLFDLVNTAVKPKAASTKPCSCKVMLLQLAIDEGGVAQSIALDSVLDRASFNSNFTLGGNAMLLDVLPSFNRTWTVLDRVLPKNEKTEQLKGGKISLEALHEVAQDVIRSAIVDILLLIGSGDGSTEGSLFDLEPLQDVCVALGELHLCPQLLV